MTVYHSETDLFHKLEKDIINLKVLYILYEIFSYRLVEILNSWHNLLVIILISNFIINAFALLLKSKLQ